MGSVNDLRLLLASGSPRRRQLIAGLDIPYEVVKAPDCDESFDPQTPVEQIPGLLARRKAQAYEGTLAPGEVLVTADTLVVCRGKVLGKPHDAAAAAEMLQLLSGTDHRVLTGVHLMSAHQNVEFTEVSTVFFRELTEEQIAYYIEHYKPFDKAGAYGIQEWIGYVGIRRIEGSYYNIMGLPVSALYAQLQAHFV